MTKMQFHASKLISGNKLGCGPLFWNSKLIWNLCQRWDFRLWRMLPGLLIFLSTDLPGQQRIIYELQESSAITRKKPPEYVDDESFKISGEFVVLLQQNERGIVASRGGIIEPFNFVSEFNEYWISGEGQFGGSFGGNHSVLCMNLITKVNGRDDLHFTNDELGCLGSLGARFPRIDVNLWYLVGQPLFLDLIAKPIPEDLVIFFRRGDVDGSGVLDITDPIFNLSHLFAGGEPPSCQDAADANDDGQVDISDSIHMLQYLFLGGPSPPIPFRLCGLDPTQDALGCNGQPSCMGE